MEDEPNLPYIGSICNEVIRWQTVAPFGLAHSADEDDVYNGYFIPAGTTMLSNIWAMHRDPSVYTEPDKFIPERWLQDKPPLDVRKTAFGFGRRICPGRFFAENAIFISIASILATFDISKALDAAGEPITPTVDYIESFLRHPKPFKCQIAPRSDAVTRAVQQAVESAK
ncbi:hypothetical protein M0805_001012 [Coniferiporia weirii]|nr:hypothetical protein M0805_001012 [Coniferiporia weirii]